MHFLSLLAANTYTVVRRLLFISTLLLMAVAWQSVAAQYRISGTVYDSSRNFPLEAVSVLTTSGRGTITNSDGVYQVEVTEKDSIWFSYLGKPTVKFPVLKIMTPSTFDISLQVNVSVLKEVKVRQRNYKQDSIQNRLDYAKVFNYEKPKLKPVTPQYGAAMGFDLNAIIQMFQFKKNRSMAAFKKRLIEQEHDKFVSHRFNKALVRRLTMLDGNELDSFMRVFRPSYQFTVAVGDYDFQQYIKTSHYRFKRGLPPEPMKREEFIEEEF